MANKEVSQFIETWQRETKTTLQLLRALPVNQYDFRPDEEGRSLGELAWHLAEGEGYISHACETGKFEPSAEVPNLQRPRTLEALAPGFERVHKDAVQRVLKLKDSDLDRTVPFIDGTPVPIRSLLWQWILFHNIHHRGQLSLMCRLAGGVAPGVYGPNREEMAAFRSKQTA